MRRLCPSRQQFLCEASHKDEEGEAFPRAAGNYDKRIIVSVRQPNAKVPHSFPSDKSLQKWLKSRDITGIFSSYRWGQAGFWISCTFPWDRQGAGMSCYYSLLHCHFYLTFSFLPFMLLLSDICSETALFPGLEAHQVSQSGFYGVFSDQEGSFCITLQTTEDKSKPSTDGFDLATVLNHLQLQLFEWFSILEELACCLLPYKISGWFKLPADGRGSEQAWRWLWWVGLCTCSDPCRHFLEYFVQLKSHRASQSWMLHW